MMAVLIASVATSWVVILFLTLGYARLVHDMRQLQSGQGTGDIGRRHVELAPAVEERTSVVLVLSSTCSTCEKVFAAWTDIAPALRSAGHRAVILGMDDSDRWGPRDGRTILAVLELEGPPLLAYQPALLVVNHNGNITSAAPLGSAEDLVERCAPLIDLASAEHLNRK